MPRAPRPPLRLLALSTTLALAAAIGTYTLLDDDDEPALSTDSIRLTPADEAEGDTDSVAFTTFEGDEVALSSLRGTPVLVNFFASTCVPCITEMPALEEVHQELGDQVTFLGLALQDRPEDALDLVERTGVTYRTAQDKDASVITALGGTVLPTTVLLDADGRILTSRSGQLDADELRQIIADELGIEA
ncbi:MAG: TlpA family protein disulfide reductase [Actinomycetota bacterium]